LWRFFRNYLQTILRMELISSKAKTLQSGPEVQLVSCLVSVSLNCFISRDPARVIPYLLYSISQFWSQNIYDEILMFVKIWGNRMATCLK
jgi:hypothetical protein